MTAFKIKCSKNKAQTVITVKQTDSVDLSGVSAIVLNLYSDDLATADGTYSFTATELSTFKSDGEVELAVADVIGADPDDDFYSVELSGDSEYLSNKAGVSITLEAMGKVYGAQGFVDPYAPDFRVDRVLHTAHMLLMEMNSIEDMDPTLQKRVDFTSRLALLKQILQYD